MQCKNPTNQ